MPTVQGYDGDPVELRYCAGSGVPYVVNWEHNALKPPSGGSWPRAVIKQVEGYIARRKWFARMRTSSLLDSVASSSSSR